MTTKRRKLQRPYGERRYRKLFVIAVEGNQTEPRYFDLFRNRESVIRVRCLKGHHDSSPPQVLKRMEDHLREQGLRRSDEAWLVVDKDQWTDEQLRELHTWAQTRDNYGFALSNPKFEFWLLLHFEDVKGVTSSRDCSDRLKRHLPGYDKGFDARQVTRERIAEAIVRARKRDQPPCVDWPRAAGGTTVYRLIERILQN